MQKILKKRRAKEPKIIRVAAGTVSTEPLHLQPIGSMSLVLESGSKAIVFEEISTNTQGSGFLPAANITIDVQKNAELHYIALVFPKTGNPPMDIVRKSRTAAGGAIYWHIVTLGGNGDRHALTSELTGKGAISSIDWISYVRGKERQFISVQNVFNAPDGGGEITMKCVAEGKASATLHGMIEITEKGRGTVTHLTEDALMLDPTAKIDAVPALEIRTNDVKASHSAAISKVSPEQLFYILSRGIPEKEARRMFVDGFLSELVVKIPDEEIRQKALEAIQSKYLH